MVGLLWRGGAKGMLPPPPHKLLGGACPPLPTPMCWNTVLFPLSNKEQFTLSISAVGEREKESERESWSVSGNSS